MTGTVSWFWGAAPIYLSHYWWAWIILGACFLAGVLIRWRIHA